MSRKHTQPTSTKLWQDTVIQCVSYALAILVPLFYSTQLWFPFTSAKTFIIAGLGAVIFVAWGLKRLANKQQSIFKITFANLSLSIFLAILTISAVLGIDPLKSFFGGFMQGTSIVFLYVIAVIALLVGQQMRNDDQYKQRFLQTLFWSGGISSLVLYFTTANELMRGGGTFGNSSYAGAYLLFIIAIGTYLLLQAKHWSKKIVYGLGVFGIVFSPVFFNHAVFGMPLQDSIANPMVLIGSANAAAIGLGIGIICAVFLFLATHAKKSLQIAGASLFVMLMSSLVYVGFVFMNPHSGLHQTYVEDKTNNRFLFWEIANQGFAERPMLGYGYNNYTYIYQKHFSPMVYQPGYAEEVRINQPHNTIFEYLSTSGILGLLSYIALFAVVFIVIFRKAVRDSSSRYLAIPLLGVLVAYFFQNLFWFDTPATLFGYFVIIAVALSFEDAGIICKEISNSAQKIVGIIAVTAGSGIFILGFVLPLQESASLRNYDQVVFGKKAYPQGISLVGDSDDGVYLSGKTYTAFDRLLDTASPREKDFLVDRIQRQIAYMERDRQQYPVTAYYYAVMEARFLQLGALATTENNSGLLERSQKLLQQAQSESPSHPQAYLFRAQGYLYSKDYEQMFAYLRAAIVLAPSYDIPREFAQQVLQVISNDSLSDLLERTP